MFYCECCSESKIEMANLWYWVGEYRQNTRDICEDCIKLLDYGRDSLENTELEDIFEAVQSGEISEEGDIQKFVERLRK